MTELERLELSLWRAQTRFDREYMDAILAADFVEFGRSGRVYGRDDVLAFGPSRIDAHLIGLRVTEIDRDTRLVTYVSEVRTADAIELANRSSLWVRSGGSWQLVFHQGTPQAEPDAAAPEPLHLRVDLADGVVLRPLDAGDADALYALIVANRDHLRAWMPWADQDEAATAGFVENASAEAARRDALHLAIVADGAIVGCCGLHGISWLHRSGNLGYWIAAGAQGTGLVTTAVRALLGYAFGQLWLHRVELRTAPDNARSRAVAERLGFTQEGELREAEHVGQRFHDSVVYSMLAGDWN
jgi:ribosomal-protein-serine acetyltransferase